MCRLAEGGELSERVERQSDLSKELEERTRAILPAEVQTLTALHEVAGVEWEHLVSGGVASLAPLELSRAEAVLNRWEGLTRVLMDRLGPESLPPLQATMQAIVRHRANLARASAKLEPLSEVEAAALRDAVKADQSAAILEEATAYFAWVAQVERALEANRYKRVRVLGKGSFGEAVLLHGGLDDIPIVGKFGGDFFDEAEWYERVGPHPNVARCLGTHEIGGEECLVLEAIGGGDVQAFFDDAPAWMSKGNLTYVEYVGALQHILRGVINALRHMHDKGLYHNDVKAMNVMIDPGSGEAKLIDFGTADRRGIMHYTPGFRGPGLFEREGEKADGYGLGLTAFQGLDGAVPDFRPERVEVTVQEALKASGVAAGRADFTLEDCSEEQRAYVEHTRVRLRRERSRHSFFTRGDTYFEQGPHRGGGGGLVPWLGDAHLFVNRLLCADPKLRPSFEEMVELPFLADPMLSEQEAQEVLRRVPQLRERA